MANGPDLEQRGLDKLNQSESWLKAHAAWLIAVVTAFVLGGMIGHLV